MLGRLWNFGKRHKKKFVVLGSVVGGGWLLYKYIWRKILEIREEEDKQYFIHLRRQHHFDSNQRTCNMTVLSMIPNIRKVLMKNLDTESVKEMLKSSPPNKLDLWEDLKIMSMTRTIAAVYGTCMLSVMLRVQLNLISGYIYLSSIHAKNPEKTKTNHCTSIPQRVKERYLSLMNEFLEQGLLDFVSFLKLAVSKEIGSLSLREQLNLENVTAVFAHVRERVECGVDRPTDSLHPFLLKGECLPDDVSSVVISTEDELLEKLIGETRDIVESNDFHTVLKESIDRGFHCLLDGMAEHYKKMNTSAGVHDNSLVVAKLIPVVNSLLVRICGDAPNNFVQELILMEELKQLAANVYEAFSQDPCENVSI